MTSARAPLQGVASVVEQSRAAAAPPPPPSVPPVAPSAVPGQTFRLTVDVSQERAARVKALAAEAAQVVAGVGRTSEICSLRWSRSLSTMPGCSGR